MSRNQQQPYPVRDASLVCDLSDDARRTVAPVWRRQCALSLCVALLLAGSPACFFQDETSDPVPDWPYDDDGDDAPDLRAALLLPETVEGDYNGEGRISSSPEGTVEQPLVGENAVLRRPLVDSLITTNLLTGPALRLFNRQARNFSPTVSTPELAIWQIEDEGVIFTLTISKEPSGPEQWNYTWLVKPQNGLDRLERVVMNGFYRPDAEGAEGRQTGSGLIYFNYDAFRFLPQISGRPEGIGLMAFRREGDGALKLNLVFQDFKATALSRPLSARYQYRINADRSGEGRYVLVDGFLTQENNPYRLGVNTVWLADGAAKSRALLVRQNGDTAVTLDECWDAEGKQVWIQWDPEIELSDGQESSCSGDLPDLDLEEPDTSATDPDEEPTIP